MSYTPNSGLSIDESTQKLTITKKWPLSNTLIFIIIGPLLAGFCSFLVLNALDSLSYNTNLATRFIGFIYLLFPIFFTLLGCLISYIGISSFFNTTTITVEENLIRIQSGPLPLLKEKQIPKEQLKQIFVRSAQSLVKSFQLSYIDPTHQAHSLLGSFLTLSFPDFNLWEAKEIERRLESFLGISDQVVLGEEQLANRPKVAGETYSGQVEPPKETVVSAPILACPESLFLEETVDGFHVFKKWRSPSILFYGMVAIFLNIGTWMFAINSIQTSIKKGGESYLMALFAIPFMIWGLWMARVVFAMLMNTSTFHINHQELVISSGPIRVFRNYTIPLNEIVALEVLTKKLSSKNYISYYKVLALNLSQGRQIEVNHNSMMTLTDEEVIYLQEKLNRKLGLLT